MPSQKLTTHAPWNEAVTDEQRFGNLTGDQQADVVVIGGGIVGIQTAWLLANEGKRVVLLEKNHIGTGDSGATTGFLTRVPDASIASLQQRHGTEFLTQLFKATRAAQKNLFERVSAVEGHADFVACDTLFCGAEPNDPAMEAEWQAIQHVENGAEHEASEIRIRDEGKFHVRKYLLELLSLPLTKGRDWVGPVTIFEESEVERLEFGDDVLVFTANGSLHAKQLVVAMGDPSPLFAELKHLIEPRLTYVLLADYTKAPIGDEIAWDTHDPYFYWRRLGERSVMLGGCDAPPGTKFEKAPLIQLKEFLKAKFGEPADITHFWSGSLFETVDGLPYAFEHPQVKNVFIAMGLGGNGLVYGSWCAEALRDLVLNRENADAELLQPRRNRQEIAGHRSTPSPALDKGGERIFLPFAKLSEIPDAKPIARTIAGETIMVVKMLGRYHAVSNVCTHAGGALCDGSLQNEIITCPLHGAKFDVTTGQVKGPPAVRALRTFATRVVGDMLEVEVGVTNETEVTKQTKAMVDPFIKWRIPFFVAVSLLWIAELFTQRAAFVRSPLSYHMLTASAYTGATLISMALFCSAIFLWFPRTAGWWRLRRTFGVSGVVFICLHVTLVWATVLKWDLNNYLFSYNPIENPMLFGSLAFPIFLAMTLTSTDWAVKKLTFKRWKFLHRFVYLAFPLMILHYVGMKPDLLKSWPGIVLISTSGLALFGQLYWFVRTTMQRGFKKSTVVGLVLILGFATLAYFALRGWKVF